MERTRYATIGDMSQLSKYANFYFGMFVSCRKIDFVVIDYFSFNARESLSSRIDIVFFAGTVVVKL